MAINPDKLRQHLDDYARTTGKKVDRFVCPITLRQCDEQELINGHILNKQLLQASTRTIIQYKGVDEYYGSRVEETLVHYFNLPHQTEADRIRQCDELTVQFSDGEKLEAFVAEGSGMAAQGKLPMLPLHLRGQPLLNVFVKTSLDDPRLKEGHVVAIASDRWMPAHWTGAMLKAGYLAMFDVAGYRWITTSFGNTIRAVLNQFYVDHAAPKQAGRYFNRFRNAVRYVGDPSLAERGVPKAMALGFDTLNDRQFLVHVMPSGDAFAVTCVFNVNGGTLMVALPYGPGDDAGNAAALAHYERLLRDGTVLQKVFQASYDGSNWTLLRPYEISYFDL